jgi:hypothetical protein
MGLKQSKEVQQSKRGGKQQSVIPIVSGGFGGSKRSSKRSSSNSKGNGSGSEGVAGAKGSSGSPGDGTRNGDESPPYSPSFSASYRNDRHDRLQAKADADALIKVNQHIRISDRPLRKLSSRNVVGSTTSNMNSPNFGLGSSSHSIRSRTESPSSVRGGMRGTRESDPVLLLESMKRSPTRLIRELSFFKDIHSVNESEGGEKIIEKMSSTQRIGDIENHHSHMSKQKRRSSIDYNEQIWGVRGSINYDAKENYHELRTILETTIGLKYLSMFMAPKDHSDSNNLTLLHCWIDCQLYYEISHYSFRCMKAIDIYSCYIKPLSPLVIDGLEAEEVHRLTRIVKDLLFNQEMQVGHGPEAAMKNDEMLEKLSIAEQVVAKNTFDALSNVVFKRMITNVYKPFTTSSEYLLFQDEMANEDSMTLGIDMQRRSCRILVDDFRYIRLLGKGGFGRVVHVMKRSTLQHFAMKIQSKSALLKFHGSDEGALELEKTMFANNANFPFICELQYALQNKECAILVLGLVGGGDLGQLIRKAPEGRLPDELGKVYSYEIALAINHLHENGIVYRDLKPSNILVADSGHLKLTDMGLAAPLYKYKNDEEDA